LPLIVEYFIGNNTKEGNGVERTEVKQWSTRSTISNSAGLIREDWGTGSPPKGLREGWEPRLFRARGKAYPCGFNRFQYSQP